MTAIAAKQMRIGAPARVDLLPPTERARREQALLTRRWAFTVVGAVVVSALVCLGAIALNAQAGIRLIAEEGRSTQLMSQLGALSDVSSMIAERDALDSYRQAVTAGDFDWAPVLATIKSRLPATTTLTGYDLAAGAPPDGADPGTAVGLSGTLEISSASPIDLAATTEFLRRGEGIMDAQVQQLAEQDGDSGTYLYTVRVEIDQRIYDTSAAPTQIG